MTSTARTLALVALAVAFGIIAASITDPARAACMDAGFSPDWCSRYADSTSADN